MANGDYFDSLADKRRLTHFNLARASACFPGKKLTIIEVLYRLPQSDELVRNVAGKLVVCKWQQALNISQHFRPLTSLSDTFEGAYDCFGMDWLFKQPGKATQEHIGLIHSWEITLNSIFFLEAGCQAHLSGDIQG